MLWPLAVAVPYLLPVHTPPWSTFYSEALMAATMLFVAVWTLRVGSKVWRADILVIGFAVAAAVPVLQALFGQFVFPSEAVLVALYLSAFALTLLVARHAECAVPLKLIDALFNALAIAALVSVGAALCQWVEIDTYAPFIAAAGPGGRPVANIAQPNNLSTLLLWGVVAIWWAHARARIGAVVAVLAAAFLLLGIALTQSRTGWLGVGVISLAAVFYRRTWPAAPRIYVVAGLAVWFILLVVSVEPASDLLMRTSALTLNNQLSAGKRPLIWLMALDEITNSPWVGYGWNQSVLAQIPLAAKYSSLSVTVQHAHNILLDLLLWNGIPLGVLMIVGLGWWFCRQATGLGSPERLLVVLALAVFALHAMLELPHAYAFFLLPVAVMMGTLSAHGPSFAAISISRLIVALLLLLHAALLTAVASDYIQIQADVMVQRLRAAKIHERQPTSTPVIRVLTGLQSALVSLRAPARDGMTPSELDTMRRTLDRYPSYWGLLHYAEAAARNRRPDDALWAVELLCDLHTASDCKSAVATWQTRVSEDGGAEMRALSPKLSVIAMAKLGQLPK